MSASTPFESAAWVERARHFIDRLSRVPGAEVRSTVIAGPATSAWLDAVEEELGRTLPPSLREFFTIGSAHMDCHYVFGPDDETRLFGGARLGPLSELPEFSRSAAAWAAETWVADEPNQHAMWTSALPFTRMVNGDYLALDLRNAEPDPPVVYLNHDDDSSVIAPNLTAFLEAWERLAYLGPEHWLLLEFVDGLGHLDPESEQAARLRRLLAV